MKTVLSAALAALLLMMTAALCAAQMDYETLSPHLTYTLLGEPDMPQLMDPGEVIGGADGPTEIVVDVTPMNLRDRIQISAVPRPAGCEFVYGTDFLVAEIIPPRS